MTRIFIDAGHGGTQFGAEIGAIREKDLNLNIAEMLEMVLPEEFQVIQSRTQDCLMSLNDRIEAINAEHYHEEIDLLVSIHHNSAPDVAEREKWNGFTAIYSATSKKSDYAARHISNAVNEAKLFRKCRTESTAQLGRRLSMIHETAPIAVLLECGFMSNAQDLEAIVSFEHKIKLAAAISSGIVNYLAQERESK